MKKSILSAVVLSFVMLLALGVQANATELNQDTYEAVIVYSKNGGTGTMEATNVMSGQTSVTLSENAFTKTGCQFVGWNTKADGTGTTYADKAVVSTSIKDASNRILLYAQWKYYTFTVTYNKNGGSGTMKAQTVNSGATLSLRKNTFKKSGYIFGGWNTKNNGTGVAYANKANVSALTKNLTADKSVKLYAQWLLKAPTVKKITVSKGTKVTVKWAKVKNNGGYEIQYSTSKKFPAKKTTSVTVKKNKTSGSFEVPTSGKTYYVRVRAFYKKSGNVIYGKWSKVSSKKVKKIATIANQPKNLSVISSKIKLSGSGTGYHAKILMATSTAAVSFGIQYDTACGSPEYRSKAAFLCENISNAAVGSGGQRYEWFGSGKRKEYYTIMMTLNPDNGQVCCYVDGKKVGTVYNEGLKGDVPVYAGIEALARLNGDKVDAYFKDFSLKYSGEKFYDDIGVLCNQVTNENAGIVATYKKNASAKEKKIVQWTEVTPEGYLHIKGTLKGIPGDWDSDYDKCSSVIHFPLFSY